MHASYLRPHPPWRATREYSDRYDPADMLAPTRLATVDDEMRSTAVDWIKAHAKDDKSFFIYLNYEKCHNPNNPSPRWKGKSPGGGTYLDALMEVDDNSGQVVQAIRDAGIAENTIVVWTTDNGAWSDDGPDAG